MSILAGLSDEQMTLVVSMPYRTGMWMSHADDEDGGVDGDDIEAHRRYAASQRIEAPYVLSAEFGRAHEVAKLPFALLIDADGVLRAKGLVNSREHLESLLEAEATGVAHIQEFMHREGHTS